MGVEVAVVTLTNGLTLSYAATGADSGRAVVLLPGPTDSWLSYRPILERMPESVRTVALSPRGHGDSDKPVTGYRVEDFAADVASAMDALGVQQAVLAGHSGSCLVARRVAIDHPDRVVGLVLEASPTSLRGDANLLAFIDTVVSPLSDPVDPAFARSFVIDTSSDDVPADLTDALVDEILKVPARVWQETFAGLLEYDDLTELPRVTIPALLVWGDADGLVDRTMQDVLLERLQDAVLLTYAGVGHTPRFEEPDRFAADLVGFVQRLR